MDSHSQTSERQLGEEKSTLRDPSKLFFQSDYTRRSILASYWIVVFLALPLWWHTTSIERLSLPSSRVLAQAGKELRFPINIQLQPSVSTSNHISLSTQLQTLLDKRSIQAPQQWKGTDIHVKSTHDSDNSSTYVVTNSEDDPTVKNRQLTFPLGDSTLSSLADLLSALLVPYAFATDQEYRVAQYSPRYRLAFTLLNEDSAAGKSVTGWDIPNAISHHISPFLNSLALLHNFTIESQVQFHAPLAFKPRHVTGDIYGLTPEDLTVFINSAEWTLSSSVSNDPVLHFIVFVPSASQRPLHILHADGSLSPSNAFLLPQWGGVVIYNPPPDTSSHFKLSSSHLDPIFSTFSGQLLALLGVPPLPPGVHTTNPESSTILTDWQLDALMRRRAMENAQGSQDTLRSIVKLVDQIENMPVGQYVKGDVQDALMALDKVYDSSATSLGLAFQYSARALTLASRAFFNPGMLALLYFPAEHKYAVYTPLFASAVIPMFAAALRELWAWRKQQREKAQKEPGQARMPGDDHPQDPLVKHD